MVSSGGGFDWRLGRVLAFGSFDMFAIDEGGAISHEPCITCHEQQSRAGSLLPPSKDGQRMTTFVQRGDD
jgi:hypothetical protein